CRAFLYLLAPQHAERHGLALARHRALAAARRFDGHRPVPAAFALEINLFEPVTRARPALRRVPPRVRAPGAEPRAGAGDERRAGNQLRSEALALAVDFAVEIE